ncbi:MAG: Mg2+ transporter [Chlamydiales bacterium]|jgi:magnesium transporter|nr:Mg2+ transporter [Chlamydiales bacterium]
MEPNIKDQRHEDSEEGLPAEREADFYEAKRYQDLLKQRLLDAFHEQTSQVAQHEVAKIAIEHDPIDLAHAVTYLPPQARHIVYENLPSLEGKTSFIINCSSNARLAIFRHIGDEEIADLLEKMPPDEAVWILDDMTDKRANRVLNLVDDAKVRRILDLQKHERNSAGRLMTNEFFSFHMNVTIGQVALHIRDHPGIDLTRRIFVINDAGELIGIVPARHLIINPRHLPLKQVMRQNVHSVQPATPREVVIELVSRYKIPALPVIDEEGVLVGVITYEDVVEAMEDIEEDTISQIAGTVEDLKEYEPTWKRFIWRAPWLIVTLFAGMVTATGMSHFQGAVWFAVVPYFISLIAGMSGNVGIQCSTLLVRGIATGEVSLSACKETVSKEISLGLMIGTVFGLLCGTFAYAINDFGLLITDIDSLVVGSIVAAGVFGACLTATCLGVFSPFFFAYWKIDPAVASGPIVTAFNDVLSSFLYFYVSYLVYSVMHP